MILAVNIGNTNIRAAVGQSGPDLDAVFPTEEILSGEHFINAAEQRFGPDLWERLEGSIVSSVVPGLTPMIEKAVEDKTGRAPKRIDVRKCGGLSLRGYSGNIGEDRVVCCIGAMKKYPQPFILIDFGTATTVNVVSGGEFLGGAILAGVQIGLNALSENTAALPRIDIDANIRVIGESTRENLVSGAVIGAACAAGGYIRRIERELGCTASVIVTGGHAPVILPYCDFECAHEPGLLLSGLFELYNKN